MKLWLKPGVYRSSGRVAVVAAAVHIYIITERHDVTWRHYAVITTTNGRHKTLIIIVDGSSSAS